jgi:MPBQ/MSBQ methyltransferase
MESVATLYSMVLRSELQSRTPVGRVRDFWNYGLWDDLTADPRQASERLMDYLLAKLPPAPIRVLDVAFGKGESTRRLCSIVGEQNVVGINIATDQVNAARKRQVNCELHVMDAAQMYFENDSFDVVLCIEAAFHFRTRASFLDRAYSVLKPGGRLIMSDILFHSNHGLSPKLFPIENQIHSLEEYRSTFMSTGFSPERVNIERTTERQLVPYFAFLARSMHMLPFVNVPDAGLMLSPAHVWHLGFMLPRLLNLCDCVIVEAEK